MLRQLKAIFLILIFGANTLIGFCCSMGMNMSFSLSSNKQISSVKNTLHTINSENHLKHKVHNTKKNTLNEGNCCNGRVVKLAKTDKSLSAFPIQINPLLFEFFLSSFLNFICVISLKSNSSYSYFLKDYHPPITDIRTAIQSFQI